MCHPDERHDICPLLIEPGAYCPCLVGVHLLILSATQTYLLLPNIMLILVTAHDRPEVSLEEWHFLEKIFYIPLQGRTWKQLVTLDAIHWYCEGPEPIDLAHRYDKNARKREPVVLFSFSLQSLYFRIILSNSFFPFPFDVEMDEGKMRALIHKNVFEHVEKWLDKKVPPTEGTSQFKLFLK